MSEPIGSTKRAKGRPVIAYLKPSDYCNVGCDHCYLPAAVRASKFRMSEETLQESLKTVEKMVASQNAPGALIIWHGGEPLALPQDYFHHICAAARAHLPGAIQSVQTSLIPYKHSWAPLIAEYLDHQIGTSVDFSQQSRVTAPPTSTSG
jgi:sulfatase maturation enzyme AslB (radical SAM superfamily)